MKENRKLLKEVLRDIQKDMTDEEIAALREASKTVMLTDTEQYTFFSYRINDFWIPFPHMKSKDEEYQMTRPVRRKIAVGA